MNCEQEGCPTDHRGKFSSCLEEALWNLSLDYADATTGSTEFRNHFALVIVRKPEEVILLNEVAITVIIPPGFYIVESNSQGQIWAYQSSSEKNALILIDEEDELYGEWLSHDGE